MNKIPLQQWITKNPIADNMIWGDAALKQMLFVRDSLSKLLWLPYPKCNEHTTVISEHVSKSIRLPVYLLDHPDKGLQICLRDNFYNWKLSVISEVPLRVDFTGLFHTSPPTDPEYTGDELSSVYFEGFPGHLIFGYYDKSDFKQWSACIYNDYMLWTTIFKICLYLNIVQPLKWPTRENHLT